jgi:hypothetical protein
VIGCPEIVTIKRDPDFGKERDLMEFRLTYEGVLLGASKNNTRAAHKHEIRRVFHKQLKRLFELHPAFSTVRPTSQEEINELGVESGAFNRIHDHQRYEARLAEFERCGYRFFPLATREWSLMCSVQILFLRPDVPGGAIQSGDIDNRLKTIFDALRIPSGKSELGGYDTPQDGENPFFCLLEDDSLISHASIETDTLLQPTGIAWDKNDTRLVITVRLSPYARIWGNVGF